MRDNRNFPHSFYHFVGDGEQHRRDREAERFGGFLVDSQFKFGWRLNRQVSRFDALEDAINISGRALKQIADVNPIGDQPPRSAMKR
jgi:hypothetical protein